MASANDTIDTLRSSRDSMVAEAKQLSNTAGQHLWTAIDDINDEIDNLIADGLADATYVPQTDSFKALTDDGKKFIGTLNGLNSVFSKIDAVVKAAETVLSIILMF